MKKILDAIKRAKTKFNNWGTVKYVAPSKQYDQPIGPMTLRQHEDKKADERMETMLRRKQNEITRAFKNTKEFGRLKIRKEDEGVNP